MLSIRMQRTGRKGHAMFRLVVQDARLTPTSGKVVAHLGSYDPHSKVANVNSEKAAFYLTHGAQPSGRAALLLKKEGVKLPKWVKLSVEKSRPVRHADKLRRNHPKETPQEETPKDEKPTEDKPVEPEAVEIAAAPPQTSPEPPADAPEAETGTTEA